MSENGTTHVVVVGGGFAGVACAKRLAGKKGVRVTLVDKNGYHQFQPLLYQVATAELTGGDIKFDLGKVFELFYTTKSHGTGLGLALARKFVEAYDGALTVASQPGEGTVFRAVFPTAAVA